MSDRLNAIKSRIEYARNGEPGAGQEDIYWLIAEVDRLRLGKSSICTKECKCRSEYPSANQQPERVVVRMPPIKNN